MESDWTILNYRFIDDLKKLGCIEKIILFGSRARNDHQSNSDIDLAIFCPKATDEEWRTILEIIEESDTLLKIDCLRFDALDANAALYKNIEREGCLIYESIPN